MACSRVERPVGPVWSRVGGDVMDLALLGRALRRDAGQRNRVAAATAAVIGVTILDVLAGLSLPRESARRPAARRPRGIGSGKPSRSTGRGTRSTASGATSRICHGSCSTSSACRCSTPGAPAGSRARRQARASNGTAELIEDQPNESIVWRSVDGAAVPNTGSVQFTPASHGGTAVLVELRYQPPGGRLAALVAKLLGDEPDTQVGSDLRRLKQVLELGEVVHSDVTALGKPRPAQPARWTDVRINAGGVS